MTAVPGGGRPRAVFFGSPDFAVPSFLRVAAQTNLVAVVTQPDRPAGRGQGLSQPAVKQAALRHHPAVPIIQPEKIRTGAFEAQLRALQADVFIVVAYGRILPQAILDIPRLGPWNVHASVLPRLRGAAPIQWAIINGDGETGVSIMRMEAGLDTGPVAALATMAIADDDTAATLSARLSVVGADLLASTLGGIVDRSLVLARQDDTHATHAPLLRKEDGRLDFAQPARLVSARARGVDPWPGAVALLDEQLVKLFGARAVSDESGGPGGTGAVAGDAPPGTILSIDANGARVACGEGMVSFSEVQLPGRKRLSPAIAAAGRAIAVGGRLG